MRVGFVIYEFITFQLSFLKCKHLKVNINLYVPFDAHAVSEERCSEVESLVFDLFANLGATGL